MPYLKMRNLFPELGTHPVLLCDSVVYDIVGKRFEEYLGQKWAHGFASLLQWRSF